MGARRGDKERKKRKPFSRRACTAVQWFLTVVVLDE